mmetsp:Transcript_37441/g.57444  ORF Transcript_37441/g.57444 Transcript_37441/m.57444 type:complete len:158 (-) Transcript_37441:74-547(-)|eukprot:CAMPEP_0118695260 /NCGR_PEP_ID=MMETSP0800-20121206/13072_1 /TAXON_ID=210618 ORGANISM="Striatella unipunctata, Strain CCMP2910" /NCGR_SAMPLE_ID=MMETSP0800 /ASSEMBLY_ACC=CAM_ASM_000638 /LENGTH=157 /DNA_ID=CAMNT_0006594001 /DNA_START=116 /DNA_END=589 /DNA_ORIENTATION=+
MLSQQTIVNCSNNAKINVDRASLTAENTITVDPGDNTTRSINITGRKSSLTDASQEMDYDNIKSVLAKKKETKDICVTAPVSPHPIRNLTTTSSQEGKTRGLTTEEAVFLSLQRALVSPAMAESTLLLFHVYDSDKRSPPDSSKQYRPRDPHPLIEN